MDCYCDYEPWLFYAARRPKARKVHKCTECRRLIQPGARYERVIGVWERGCKPDTFVTCGNCVALREYVEAHVPCLCWAHGNMVEDCMETVREFAHEADGLLFGAWRRWRSKKYMSLDGCGSL